MEIQRVGLNLFRLMKGIWGFDNVSLLNWEKNVKQKDKLTF